MAVKATRVKGTVMLNQPNAKKSLGKRISTEVKRHWQLYVMLILPVTYLIIFAYLPMGGAVIAFKDYSIRGGIWGSDWVGLKHFKNFFTTPDFKVLMRNTLALSLYSLVISFPMPILLALAINEMRGRHYKKVVQMVTSLPYFISTVVLVGIMPVSYTHLAFPVRSLAEALDIPFIVGHGICGDAGLLFPPGQEFFDFTVVVISYLRSVEAQAFQEEYGVLLPGHAVGLFRFNIPKKAGAAVDVAEIHALYPVEHFFPGFRLQGAELIQSLALVVAVGLAEPLLAEGHAVFVHQFIDVVEFQVKPGYGGPVIGGGPVVELSLIHI